MLVADTANQGDAKRREQAAVYRDSVARERESAELPETALDSPIGA